ncbi:MAG: pyridoxamine 5'-phosphate oxidase family protein [Treponema sp.]|nr:pyridoxamine 5'-phosphate oxidase family protein [Treponema sp.]
MEKIVQFLKDCKMFFLATSDGDQARVRPMGFVMVYEGKLCFATSNNKPMFRQMKANPKVELCATMPDGKTLRVSGSVGFLSTRDAKEKALEVAPQLKRMYSADDGLFEVFRLENGIAVFSDMAGNREEMTF